MNTNAEYTTPQIKQSTPRHTISGMKSEIGGNGVDIVMKCISRLYDYLVFNILLYLFRSYVFVYIFMHLNNKTECCKGLILPEICEPYFTESISGFPNHGDNILVSSGPQNIYQVIRAMWSPRKSAAFCIQRIKQLDFMHHCTNPFTTDLEI